MIIPTEQNPALWASVSPSTYPADSWGPLPLRHSETEYVVPVAWSGTPAEELKVVDNRPRAWHVYPADNHNISINPGVATQCNLAFFDTYVKGEGE